MFFNIVNSVLELTKRYVFSLRPVFAARFYLLISFSMPFLYFDLLCQTWFVAYLSFVFRIDIYTYILLIIFICFFVCLFLNTFGRFNVIAKSIIYYFLPLSIIGVLYALMARRLHLSAQEMPGELVGPQRAQARARRHVARMVLTFVIGKWDLLYPFKAQNDSSF